MATNIFKRLRLIQLRGQLEESLFHIDAANRLVIAGDSVDWNAIRDARDGIARELQRVLSSLQALDDADGSTVK